MDTLRRQLSADTVLCIGAHADDTDFTAGGTVARLADEGAAVYYLVLTDGSKGTADATVSPQALIGSRREEQRNAARALGVREVYFLDYEDGMLAPDHDVKRDIVRHIRRLKPDVVYTIDPTMVYYAPYGSVNHPDHRACGQAVLDAVYPLARDHLSYPELLQDEGLQTHAVRTVLMNNYAAQDFFVDISSTIDRKLQAITAHISQIPDPEAVRQRYRERAVEIGRPAGFEYAEGFVRIADIRV